MQPLGKQFLVEFYNCDQQILNDVEKISTIMQDAAKCIGATIVDTKFHRFTPHGVSGVVLIAESHIAIHTWPEFGYAAFDLFTCGSKFDSVRCFEYVKQKLKAVTSNLVKLNRGTMPLKNKENYCPTS